MFLKLSLRYHFTFAAPLNSLICTLSSRKHSSISDCVEWPLDSGRMNNRSTLVFRTSFSLQNSFSPQGLY
ncbi:unnamed protein product [Cylicocyclus nassatus]|uniref:Uncharacterized protein n=1 Tax=Cylicocyclus nassatus TaxID=53992 RepID=A0AA36MAA0_CYLNA|nr:unnamed protein product [Cylicocyclus nassatus]